MADRELNKTENQMIS